MSNQPLFASRLLIVWVTAAVSVFAISLYFIGSSPLGVEGTGPGTYSRSAIGYAGLAEVLQQVGIPVVQSRSSSLDKLSPGSVLVVAEPLPDTRSQATAGALVKADKVLLVLPKWSGQPSRDRPGWLAAAALQPPLVPDQTLRLVAPRGQVLRIDHSVTWSTNALELAPQIEQPIQLVSGAALVPVIGAAEGVLLGEMRQGGRRIWVLADPDILADHSLARGDNAALAVAIFEALRQDDGKAVFDETIHGIQVQPESPLRLLFRFPYAIAAAQALLAAALLLWATLGRFGAPQAAPVPLQSGREGLLRNSAMLLDFLLVITRQSCAAMSMRPSAMPPASCMRLRGIPAWSSSAGCSGSRSRAE